MSEREQFLGVLGELGIQHEDDRQRIELEAKPHRVVVNFDESGSFAHVRINEDVFQRDSVVGKLFVHALQDRGSHPSPPPC